MHAPEGASPESCLALGSARAAEVTETRADAVVLPVQRGLEAAGGRGAVVVGGPGRHVIRRPIDPSLVRRCPVPLTVCLCIVRVVVRVVEIRVVVGVVLLAVRLGLRGRRCLAGGLLLSRRLGRGVRRGVAAALRVGRHATKPRLVV